MIPKKAISGKNVLLEPLTREHFSEIIPLALEKDLWLKSPSKMDNESDVRLYLDEALRLSQTESFSAFVTKTAADDKIVGMTRYRDIVEAHKRLEIGSTWISKDWRRTFVNTEAKYLMLKFAFEELDFNRVEFKTDTRNQRSRNAILRIGAKEEGIFRKHMCIPKNNDTRDSVYFSILKDEWPSVKQRLLEMMDRSV